MRPAKHDQLQGGTSLSLSLSLSLSPSLSFTDTLHPPAPAGSAGQTEMILSSMSLLTHQTKLSMSCLMSTARASLLSTRDNPTVTAPSPSPPTTPPTTPPAAGSMS